MNRYTIYCTEEQTRKALELGAPILADTHEIKFTDLNGVPFDVDRIVIPTAEEMIGWLNEQGIATDVVFIPETKTYKAYCKYKCYISTNRKEATLAAIDKALEYLTNNKK